MDVFFQRTNVGDTWKVWARRLSSEQASAGFFVVFQWNVRRGGSARVTVVIFFFGSGNTVLRSDGSDFLSNGNGAYFRGSD